MRWAWITCASLSVAAHALAVTLLPALESPARTQHRLTGSPKVWQIRVATKSPAPTSPEAEPSLAQASPAHAGLNVDAPEPAIENPPQDSDPLESATPPDTTTVQASEVQNALTDAAHPPVPTAGEWSGDSEYIPRPQLSIPPVPLAPVIMTPPDGSYKPARISGILSLYIDETGRIHHIVSSGTPMPPEFEEAARQAFMALSFRPGMLDGVAVKSRIRIEVVFDNTPLTENAPQAPTASAPR